MSVVGIDFGNLNTVVAVARNRGIDVIVNEVSNRATPSLVSMGEKQRYLGESAKTQELFNFKNTVSSLKRLIARPFSDPAVMSIEKPFVNAPLVSGLDGQVAASVMLCNESRTFTFTELAAMFFSKVKDFTSAELKIPVTDAVISCPLWYTDVQRRALIDSASIAGINILRVLNDTTSAALGYGITKLDLPDPADAAHKPRIVVFVDLGHSSYQVAVASLVKGKLIIKGTAYDQNLGGRDFDQVLTAHFTQVFDKKYKMDIASNAKATFRLRQQCEKVKKILSANAVTMLNVECLMDDKDVSSDANRTDFEEWITPIVQRLLPPLEQALAAAGITVKDVDSVELVGGSTRIPLVKETIAKFFGGTAEENILMTTLNQDEAVARGAALQCAIVSPVFKVRDFSVQDWNAFPIELTWDSSQNSSKSENLQTVMDAFPVGNGVPSSKILTFYRAIRESEMKDGEVDFNFEARYGDSYPNFPQGIGHHIGNWSLKGIKKRSTAELVEDSKTTIKVKTKLDANGVLVIESASQVEEMVVPVETAEPSAMETDESPKDAIPTPVPTPDITATTNGKTKKVIKKFDLNVEAKTRGTSPEILNSWIAAEAEMQSNDRLVIDTADRKNALEEYVYETRSKLEMAWSEFMLDSERTSFLNALNSMEDWLYGEGEDATKSVYSEKLAELKKTGDPVAFRYLENEERPFVEKKFKEYVNSVLLLSESENEKYAHLEKADWSSISSECTKKSNWLNEIIGKQNEMKKHLNPVVTCADIKKEMESLSFVVNPILNKPKPKVVEKKEEKVEESKMDEDTKAEVPKEPEDMAVD